MRVRVHPAFAVYLLSIAVFRSPVQAVCAVTALLVHEGAHALAAQWIGERFERVDITPFGGMMTYQEGESPSKGIRGICVAAAGPAGNYLLLSLLGFAGRRFSIPEEWIRQMIVANAAMMLINLLPALPLDGGRMVFCTAYYVMGVSLLLRMLTALGMALGGALILLGVYGAVKLGVVNLSLLIVGSYLIVCAASSRDALLGENLYAVVQERASAEDKRARRLTLYRVSAGTPLYTLLGAMDRTPAAAFLVEGEDGVALLSEPMFLRALLWNSSATVGDAFEAQKGERIKNKDTE
ncbi:MAG: M50 family metallopeptidase [Clostridia bacterium]|nr:M50 family metallopeptidase [Clostridia bacterium]